MNIFIKYGWKLQYIQKVLTNKEIYLLQKKWDLEISWQQFWMTRDTQE